MTVMTDRPDLGSLIPLASTLGIELETSTPDEVRARMAWKAELCTTMGVLHGGALMAFADTLGAVCASHHLPEGALTTTIESKTNFLRAVTEGNVTGTSRTVHAGRRTIVVQTELRNDAGKLVALVTQTQAVIQP
jgi:1,4-dihydroxy-2-naphthoyl-CoA hydrolase